MPPLVPATVIAGFLGVGKTTAVTALAARMPAGERWAVVVNEYGEVGIDGAILGGGELAVRELPGGCVCCAGSGPFRAVLARVLREVQPTRLLIEPTGLADAGRLLDTLRGPDLAGSLDLRAAITLVDPRHFADPRIASSAAWRSQVEAADVLVANRCDRAGEAALRAFLAEAAEMFPPKRVIAATTWGELDPAWLDLPFEHRPATPAHDLPLVAPVLVDAGGLVDPRAASRLLRRAWAGADFATFGWIFAPEVVFSRPKVAALLAELWAGGPLLPGGAMRIKGVLRTSAGWQVVQADADGVRWRPAAWRADSRLEIIASQEGDSPGVLARLRAAEEPA